MTIRSAIILAAGRGSRLGAHTARVPKCLVRLGGRCLLDWQIAALHAAGVDDITLVAGYRAERLKKYTDLRIVRNAEWECSGPVASMLLAGPEKYSQGFFVVYGDGVFHPGLIAALGQLPQTVGITSDTQWHALWSARFDEVLSDAECFRSEAAKLRRIGGRALSIADIQGQFTGLVKFGAAGWVAARQALARSDAGDTATLDMTGLLAKLLAADIEIGVAPVAGRWCEVDSASDLILYRRSLRRRQWSHDWRWAAGLAWA